MPDPALWRPVDWFDRLLCRVFGHKPTTFLDDLYCARCSEGKRKR